ncbi:hypothetical protein [Dyadobacter frigoris]|uniref:Uncharacterized protein n=1 Tax=Dyadobacter frigoris TaxID=2576211 RepID=A0A4U6D2G1_9BACT|nr:hypothetical protein [Dyadobacter frigoris]TKT91459.1 hypothetical protein FDK13_13890 [Dyadobacter frigoris]GLU51985.1 hypothetical protein Dfri01_14460 [Dyadobacter frigoris]
MGKEHKNTNVAGGSPSSSGPENPANDPVLQEDDSKRPSKEIKKEAIDESESENMTNKKGYNETDPNVPVKTVKTP